MLLTSLALNLILLQKATLNERLYYLNSPESIRQEGIVGQFQTSSEYQKTRIFFHYINKTSITQTYVLHLNKSISQFTYGYGLSKSPGQAGAIGVCNFLNAKSTYKDNGVLFKIDIKPGVIISGVCEGITPPNTKTISYFTSVKPQRWNILESTNLNEFQSITLKENQKHILRIGTKRLNYVPGDYGTLFNFKINSNITKPKKLKIVISPRGGHAAICFSKLNKFYISPVISAKSSYVLYEQTIQPNEHFNFQIMLPGGYAYPLEISFSV